ncbi:hypothetical protein [Granulicoccus sp. GXG6511]|uniref:hypothetical protein n=1 Tax=Granulicoccus sp. GXG6511 TaxID=3381351 RepID=UPI003D7CD7F7
MRRLLRRWGVALALVALVILYVALKVAQQESDGIVWAGVLLPAAFVFSPLMFPRPRATRADALAAPDRVAIYYKPADFFCIRTRLALGSIAKKALWIDAIADPEAEAWVREVNRGDLLAPTVVIGEELKRNPDPHWIGRHLLPPEAESAEQSNRPTDS